MSTFTLNSLVLRLHDNYFLSSNIETGDVQNTFPECSEKRSEMRPDLCLVYFRVNIQCNSRALLTNSQFLLIYIALRLDRALRFISMSNF